MLTYPKTAEEFNNCVAEIKNGNYADPLLYAIGGEVRTTAEGLLASARFPYVNGPQKNTGTAAILMKVLGVNPLGVQTLNPTRQQLQEVLNYFMPFENDGKPHHNMAMLKLALDNYNKGNKPVVSFIFPDEQKKDPDVQGVVDATLKLYGMSTRKFKPGELNLSGIFSVLPNVVWEGDTPMDTTDVDRRLKQAAFGGKSCSLDRSSKIPLFINRVNPLSLGIIIEGNVRLGAYLGEGTKVLPGGFVNFGAGTGRNVMAAGSINSGTFVGDGSNILSGARTIGVMSFGNRPISIGKNCILGLNSTLGISIGDATIISAGVSIEAGTLVLIQIPGHDKKGKIVKAQELSGISGVTFRNGSDGCIEIVKTNENEKLLEKLGTGDYAFDSSLINR